MPAVQCSFCEHRFESPEPLTNQMCPRCGFFFDATVPLAKLSETASKIRFYRKVAIWLDILAIGLPLPAMLLTVYLLTLLDGIPPDIGEKTLTIFCTCLGVSAIFAIGIFCTGRCPACRMTSLSFRHSRKDGQADLRFKDNPLVCSCCGWKSLSSQQDDCP